MTATTDRIGFVLRATRNITAGPSQTVIDQHGSSARDTEEPVITLLNSVADGEQHALQAFGLLSANRRRFEHIVDGVETAEAIQDAQGVTTITLIDEDRDVSAPFLVAQAMPDYDADQSILTLWG